jgi:hypothetical protein
MFGLDLFQLSTTARTGPAQWLAEVVAAFGLLLTILGLLRVKPDQIPAAVGLYITSAYWFRHRHPSPIPQLRLHARCRTPLLASPHRTCWLSLSRKPVER